MLCFCIDFVSQKRAPIYVDEFDCIFDSVYLTAFLFCFYCNFKTRYTRIVIFTARTFSIYCEFSRIFFMFPFVTLVYQFIIHNLTMIFLSIFLYLSVKLFLVFALNSLFFFFTNLCISYCTLERMLCFY